MDSRPGSVPFAGGAMGERDAAYKRRFHCIHETGKTSEKARIANLTRVFVSVTERNQLPLTDV